MASSLLYYYPFAVIAVVAQSPFVSFLIIVSTLRSFADVQWTSFTCWPIASPPDTTSICFASSRRSPVETAYVIFTLVHEPRISFDLCGRAWSLAGHLRWRYRNEQQTVTLRPKHLLRFRDALHLPIHVVGRSWIIQPGWSESGTAFACYVLGNQVIHSSYRLRQSVSTRSLFHQKERCSQPFFP